MIPGDLNTTKPEAATQFEIRRDDLAGPEIKDLLTEHLRSLAAITPKGSMHALDLDRLRRPEITFWSVWSGGTLVGCGAVKELDPRHGEVKSMRTAAPHLRKGAATLLLQHIITEATRRGYERLSLETGASAHFEPARQLYRRFGFEPCPPFVGYKEDPNSVFMTKKLIEKA